LTTEVVPREGATSTQTAGFVIMGAGSASCTWTFCAALKRRNVYLPKHAHVAKVISEGTIATGVEYESAGKRTVVHARKEVIFVPAPPVSTSSCHWQALALPRC
jgi:choline dehydrogenase-like flavoprotein